VINEEVEHIIKAELREGERIVWSGAPEQPPRTMGQSFQFVFSCIWLTMVVLIFLPVGLVTAFSGEESAFGWFFTFFILLFVLVGIGMVILNYRALKAPNFEVYAITNQRGLILSTYRKIMVTSLSPNDLLSSERKPRRDGLATLSFGTGPSSIFEIQSAMFGMKTQTSFKNISDSKEVENLIYKIFGKTGTPS